MTRLFTSVYLDEDVSVLVADLLRSRGFRALTTREAGQLGRPDAEQLRFAATNGMALLTHNRAEFERLHLGYLAEGRAHGGVLIAARRRPYLLVANLLPLLDRLTADEMRGQLLYL